MKHRVLLAEMTREQIRSIAPQTVVVLPTAAIEQHGPHLTIMTDTLACATVCERAAALASETTPVTVAPILPYGMSHHHFPFPGVMSLTTETFVTVLLELGDSLVKSGFRHIAIINGHGGNDEAIRVAAREIGLRHEVAVAAASYWTIALPALIGEGRGEEVGNLPDHAGAFETSLVMALRPELVDASAFGPSQGEPPIRANQNRVPLVEGGVVYEALEDPDWPLTELARR